MAGKDIIGPVHIITNGSMTGTSVLTSTVVDIRHFDNVGFACTWTGTANGTFSFEVSNDYTAEPTGTVNAGNWTAYPISPSPVAAGTASTIFVDINQSGGAYCRVKYTNSSSTGTLNVYLMGKMV